LKEARRAGTVAKYVAPSALKNDWMDAWSHALTDAAIAWRAFGAQ
jgi:hypothetical protein